MITRRLYYFNIIAIALYVTISVTCDLLSYKPITIFGHITIAASLLFMSLFSLLDVITQLNSRAFGIFALILMHICDCIYTFTLYGISHLNSPNFWHLQPQFNSVINPIVNLYWAGLLGGLAAGVCDVYVFTKLKAYFKNSFFLRAVISSILAIIVYTLITDYFSFKHHFPQHLDSIITTNTISNISFAIIYCFISSLLIKPLSEFLHKGKLSNVYS